jgi:bifunctional non-homologous end joining protein LigD
VPPTVLASGDAGATACGRRRAAYIARVPRNRFIEPAAPVPRTEPPTGPEWLHEVKHDGWRAQLHIRDRRATIFGKNGGDLTRRFRAIAAAVDRLPVASAIIDAELVACNADGTPNFYAMMRGAPDGCCAYCFDMMEFDGRSLVVAPLEERRYLLRKLLKRAGIDGLRLSEVFDDPRALLAACEKHGLEGIVSKRRGDPYRHGANSGWVKVKTAAWRAANQERLLFTLRGGQQTAGGAKGRGHG